jgi:hypothetical protein
MQSDDPSGDERDDRKNSDFESEDISDQNQVEKRASVGS